MNYIRDKRSPIPSSIVASKVMSSIKAKDTKPELILRKLLSSNNLRGYRLHWNVEGRPDIAFVKRKIAMFINGCYWHRCPYCNLPIPKSNPQFWRNKFEKNVARDLTKTLLLRKKGWIVLTFWECQIKKNPLRLIQKVELALKKRHLLFFMLIYFVNIFFFNRFGIKWMSNHLVG